MKRVLNIAAGLVLACLASTAATAATIDTTSSFISDISTFGVPDTATYGQTFTAQGSLLNSFSLYLDNLNSAPVTNLRGYIGTWNGAEVGSLLYESATVTTSGAARQEFTFSPNLAVTNAATYVAFLSIANLPVQPDAGFSMPYGADTIAGNFVYINNGQDPSQWTSTAWTLDYVGTSDVFFKATFDNAVSVGVPEPMTLALFGAGVAGAAAFARRRKSKQT